MDLRPAPSRGPSPSTSDATESHAQETRSARLGGTGETAPAARRLRRARFPTGRGGWPVRAHTTATCLALLWLLIQRGLEKSLGPAVQTRPRTPGADAHPTRRGRRPAIGLVTRGCSAVTAPGHPPRGVRRRPGLRGPPAAPAPKLCRLSQGQPGKQGQPLAPRAAPDLPRPPAALRPCLGMTSGCTPSTGSHPADLPSGARTSLFCARQLGLPCPANLGSSSGGTFLSESAV